MADYFSLVLDFIAGHPHYAVAAVFVLALSEPVPPGRHRGAGLNAYYRNLCSGNGRGYKPVAIAWSCRGGAIVGDGFSFGWDSATIEKSCKPGR